MLIQVMIELGIMPDLPLALPGVRYYLPSRARPPESPIHSDVVVYGATAGGITAAIRAARDGYSVTLLAFGDRLGGMTASGLGTTDVGDPSTVAGLARTFYIAVANEYRARSPHWDVEASVAEEIFETWLADAGVNVCRRQHLDSVTMRNGRITELRTDDGSAYRGHVYVDASYEGDLMAAAGVSYTTGREASSLYGEALAGVQHSVNHQFTRGVDPFVVPGRPESGPLPGVSSDTYGQVGDGDHRIQAYTFRLHVTTSPHRVRWPRPEGYDPERYELLARYVDAGMYELFGRTTRVHADVYDMNNHGAFSSDHIGANYDWPEASYARREEIFQDHVRYQAGLLYFLATDPRVPDPVHERTRSFGLASSEFRDTSHWPHQLYIREARRMVSDYVVTEHDATGRARVDDPVAMASYVIDSHNAKRVIVDGDPRNEGNVQQPITSAFGIPYRALVPRAGECENLLVAAAVSASHVAYASVRMEPVFMMLGEVCGSAAVLAVKDQLSVQNIEYEALRRQLAINGARLALAAA